jgi:hypothetical protein
MRGSSMPRLTHSPHSAGQKGRNVHGFVRDLSLIMGGSAAGTVVFAALCRFAWRRGKKLQEP